MYSLQVIFTILAMKQVHPTPQKLNSVSDTMSDTLLLINESHQHNLLLMLYIQDT